jgi:hypothetical protein
VSILELNSQIHALAWSARGTDALKTATASPSPVAVIVAAFSDLKDRVEDLNDSEIEILRSSCQLIRNNQWYNLALDTVAVEAALPAPVTAAIVGAGLPATDPALLSGEE